MLYFLQNIKSPTERSCRFDDGSVDLQLLGSAEDEGLIEHGMALEVFAAIRRIFSLICQSE